VKVTTILQSEEGHGRKSARAARFIAWLVSTRLNAATKRAVTTNADALKQPQRACVPSLPAAMPV
jgi:hypothetical protein